MKNKIADYFGAEIFLIIFASCLFIFNVSNFSKLYFDEFHYIPAAKDLVASMASTNLEHPPLGKIILGVSIRLLGDSSVGWRTPTIIFGVLSIFLIFKIALSLFKDYLTAFLVGLIAISNMWIYIQSRIAMLDIFLLFFILMGIYFYLKTRKKTSIINDLICFISFGFATAVKWNAIFIFIPTLVFYFYENRNISRLIVLVIISMIFYYLTFIPIYLSWKLNYSIQYIIFELPFEMLKLQKSVLADHPYKSKWFTWPLMIRPIWYEFIKDASGNFFQGVILLGNPIQMLLGFLGAIYLLFKTMKKNIKIDELYFLTLFITSWLIWALVPRGLQFFYYFFIPACLYVFIIPLSINKIIHEKINFTLIIIVVISFCFFGYFFPVISGNLTPEAIRMKWAWFESWI